MSVQYTPGPWVAVEINGFFMVKQDLRIGAHTIAEVFGEANARLVAETPNLLEMLRQIVNEMQVASSRGRGVNQAWLDRRIERGRAAIAKAEAEGR